MTSGILPAPRLLVVGVDVRGAEVARLPLGHGDDPTTLLAAAGWRVRLVRDVLRDPVERQLLTLTFMVEPAPVAEPPAATPRTVGPTARRVQRVAAYAVVTSSRGLLMTQFSDRTGAPGQWGLPGGGLEAEEAPEHAVVREVWEESGQVVEVTGLALVQSSHWVGRAPAGQLEDFHAVRVVYRAVCPEPTEPVVHDVGGTTASAAWLLPEDVDLRPLTSSWRSILSDVVMAPDQTDGPDHRQYDPDADDRARPQP